jgi:hypothetical protein
MSNTKTKFNVHNVTANVNDTYECDTIEDVIDMIIDSRDNRKYWNDIYYSLSADEARNELNHIISLTNLTENQIHAVIDACDFEKNMLIIKNAELIQHQIYPNFYFPQNAGGFKFGNKHYIITKHSALEVTKVYKKYDHLEQRICFEFADYYSDELEIKIDTSSDFILHYLEDEKIADREQILTEYVIESIREELSEYASENADSENQLVLTDEIANDIEEIVDDIVSHMLETASSYDNN